MPRSPWRCCSRTATRSRRPRGRRSRPPPRTILVLADFDEDGELDIATEGTSPAARAGGRGRFGPSPRRRRRGRRGGSCRGTSTATATSTSWPRARGPSTDPMVLLGTGGGGFHDRRAGAVRRRDLPPGGVRDRGLQRRPPGRPVRHAAGGSTWWAPRRMGSGGCSWAATRRGPELDRGRPLAGGAGRVRRGDSADLDEDGRPDVLTANSGRPWPRTRCRCCSTRQPWPLLQFPTGDVAEMGNWAVNTISGFATLNVQNTGGDALRVRRTEFAGSIPTSSSRRRTPARG